MQRPTRVRRRHTPAQRAELLAAYQRRGLTQKQCAAEAGIGCSTLTLWLRQAGTAKTFAQPAFVPVPNVFPAAAPPPTCRVLFPQGVTVEVAAGFPSAELGALFQWVQTL